MGWGNEDGGIRPHQNLAIFKIKYSAAARLITIAYEEAILLLWIAVLDVERCLIGTHLGPVA